jgi:ribosomal-protein-alanine N-acetyltransferase
VELAYALMPQHQGRGSATEIGKLATQLGFENLGLTEVVGFVQPENTRSEQVLMRCGFESESSIERSGLPHRLYRRRAGQRPA